jgi:hypothetical protein
MEQCILLRSLPSRHSDTQLEPFRLCLRPTDLTDHEGFSRQLRRCSMRQDRSVLLCVTISCFIGLAVLLVPTGYVYPRENNQSCNAKGYALCPNGQCGSQNCSNNGKPGENFCNAIKCYMCDGCTGQWVGVGSSRSGPGPGGMVPPESSGTLMPPTSPPTPSHRMPGTVAPGMTAPIMPRGIEGEQPAEPPPGTPEPAEQPSGKKSE